ncbi:hypothetical protein PRIPAC_78762 [Pristionchus pacificus]|uniref:Uncharacterized protein n=1 Tax=Pristionchus pacificus TaxID=54126 RepID=A0A2A6CJP4_PRIPA|nr:hypothetical protein PRIPAC_78762 [Pristionchus pacificus]|eukprot:PDM78445.1 hypothetical protein PRIPAC_31024 [Pristionchus pacificus]
MNAKIILFVAVVALLAVQQSEAQVVVPAAYTALASPYYGAYYGWPRLGYSAWGYPGYAAWWGANKGKGGAAAAAPAAAAPSGLTGNQ